MYSGFILDFIIMFLVRCKINCFDILELFLLNKVILFFLYFLGFLKFRKSYLFYFCLIFKIFVIVRKDVVLV